MRKVREPINHHFFLGDNQTIRPTLGYAQADFNPDPIGSYFAL